MFNLKPQNLSPVKRIYTNSWQQLGHVKREPDSRTTEQLKQTIDAYTKQIPEIKSFIEHIKQLPQKHMGLVADTLELSTHKDLLMSNIDLKNVNGNNVCKKIVEDIIDASKNNPKSLELVEAVFNNTDAPTAKYVLTSLSGGILKNKNFSDKCSETAKFVHQIAKETLSGGYLGNYEKSRNFNNFLGLILNPETKVDKIKPLFLDITKFAESRPENLVIDVYKFLTSDAKIEKIKGNLEILPNILDRIANKSNPFELVDFVLKNTNLK